MRRKSGQEPEVLRPAPPEVKHSQNSVGTFRLRIADRTRVFRAAGFVVSLWLLPIEGATTGQPGIRELLDRYEDGAHPEVVSLLDGVPVQRVDDLSRDLEEAGDAWVRAGTASAVPRRRLVAATFALEFANARLDDAWWQGVRHLVEWGCERLREGPPSAGERIWHLASVALVQGQRDWNVLWPPSRLRIGGVRRSQYDHLRHALDRSPDDPRLQFTGPLVDALIQTVSRDADGRWDGQEAPDPTGHYKEFSAPDRLRPFLDHPSLGPEAHLWTGLVLGVTLQQVPDAMRHLEAASKSDDPFVAYLAHYWAGRFQESGDRLAEAEDQYRSALRVSPRTQSASLSLSALLMKLDRPDEAYRVMESAFQSLQPPDPFKTYGFGDYRFMDEYLIQLRGEIAE